jgi:hypothetical protein
MNKNLSPQAPFIVESYPPITLVLIHLASNDVFIINNDKTITCLVHTSLLIIVWEPWPLNIVTIHYLRWGFKIWGVTSPRTYFGFFMCAYTN